MSAITVELVDLQDDGTHMTAAIEYTTHNPQAAKARAKRSRQALVDKGLNNDRMVVDFASMLGTTPHDGTEPLLKPTTRDFEATAPSVGKVTDMTRRL